MATRSSSKLFWVITVISPILLGAISFARFIRMTFDRDWDTLHFSDTHVWRSSCKFWKAQDPQQTMPYDVKDLENVNYAGLLK